MGILTFAFFLGSPQIAPGRSRRHRADHSVLMGLCFSRGSWAADRARFHHPEHLPRHSPALSRPCRPERLGPCGARHPGRRSPNAFRGQFSVHVLSVIARRRNCRTYPAAHVVPVPESATEHRFACLRFQFANGDGAIPLRFAPAARTPDADRRCKSIELPLTARCRTLS